MNILCIDIGKGTQDILYYNTNLKNNVENAIKLILPSPTTIISNKIKNMNCNLKIDGNIMGGGPVNKAISNLQEKGHSVEISKNCAKTIRDNLEEVEKKGIFIKENISNPNIIFGDLNFNMFKNIFNEIGEIFKPDFVCVACQDHGYIPNQSDRITRFKYFKNLMKKTQNPLEYIFTEKSKELNNFSRFKSNMEQIKKNNYNGFVMDSKIASVCGILNYANENNINEFVGLDIGNGHTLGVSIKEGKILGLFEHHTTNLTSKKLYYIVNKLINGTLTNKEIFNDNGHGAVVLNKINPEKIYISGPNRALFKEYGEYAYPYGDVMITGCIGLLDCYNYNF